MFMFCPRRQARRPLHQLDGRGGEGGDAVAADAGQTQLLGGGQRDAQAAARHRQGPGAVIKYIQSVTLSHVYFYFYIFLLVVVWKMFRSINCDM